MSSTPSPLAVPMPAMPTIDGVRIFTARAGYKAWDRDDLTLALFEEGTAVAGVTTQSKCPSPEVEWCRSILPGGTARALVVNAGNSNAFTGGLGRRAVESITGHLALRLTCQPAEIFIASTGLIGVPLPFPKARAGIDAALSAAPSDWSAAARAIGTTDTFPKGVTRSVSIEGRTISICGIIKGSGMIAPDMATMLGFLFTDAAVAPSFLQACLSAANRTSFSCITVDSDTSTSDTVLAFATGRAGNAPLASLDDPGARDFAATMHDICLELAQLVVRDGEGASKLIEVAVTGAVSDASARTVALSIANSPLVKTAVAGEDANWGRVVAAVGKAGEQAERDTLSIWFGETAVARSGLAVEGYDEAPVAAHLKGRDIKIMADLGIGNGCATVWTCDLTHAYIDINAHYRS